MGPTRRFLLVAAVLTTGVVSVLAEKNVLVLYGQSSLKESHSQFFAALGEHGYKLDYMSVKASDLKIQDYDNYLYDHIIIMAPKASSFGGAVNPAAIQEFVSSGRNLVLVAGSDSSDTIRSLAQECGADLDDKGTAVYDHFHYQSYGGASDHTVITTNIVAKIQPILPSKLPGPVLYKGIAHTVPASNELVTVLLSADPTGYSHDPSKALPEPPALPVGGTAALVSAVQARNNARVLVAGSLDLFSDEFFNAKVQPAGSDKSVPSGNKEFCVSAALWTFKETGVIEISNVQHRIAGGEVDPPLYRVKDDVEFTLDIFELSGGKSKPYKADDVQVSFVMLDPYYRVPLEHDGKGHFVLKFQVPDVYGVFKYFIQYRHRGYSYIDLEQVVPVRPFKHDEYERFLLAAYPYYASAASAMVAFFLVGLALFYTK